MPTMSPRAVLPLLFALAACQPSPNGDTGAPAAAPPTPPVVPARDAVRDVKASMQRFLAARRFHARMQVEGARPMTGEMDYVAPDRYRIALPGGTQTVIGNVLYMQVDGRRTQVPLPPETLAPWRDPLAFQQAGQGLSAEHVGNDTIAGHPARRYRVRHDDPEAVAFDYWIGPGGLPLQLRHSGRDDEGRAYTVLLTYSRYDDPAISIDAPP
jgi:hypothetical protein